MKINSTRKLSTWSCSLKYNLPKHILYTFSSLQWTSNVIPLDAIPHLRHTQIMKSYWLCKSFYYKIIWLKECLKHLSTISHLKINLLLIRSFIHGYLKFQIWIWIYALTFPVMVYINLGIFSERLTGILSGFFYGFWHFSSYV